MSLSQYCGSNDNRVAEEARLSRKGSIISSFKCVPSNRLLKFAACVSATDSLRCMSLFAQTLYFSLSASFKDNIFTSLPSLKRSTSESFSIYSLNILLIYSLRSDSLRYYVYIYIYYIYIYVPLHCRPFLYATARPEPPSHNLKATSAIVSKSRSIFYCKTPRRGFKLEVP